MMPKTVETLQTTPRVFKGWEMKRNTFGGVKLFRKSPFREQMVTIDIWKLRKHEPCRRDHVEYSIENFLKLAPLTVQSIAVDLQNGLVRRVINALLNRTVAVNHKAEMANYCRVCNTTLEELVMKKAGEYNFTPIL